MAGVVHSGGLAWGRGKFWPWCCCCYCGCDICCWVTVAVGALLKISGLLALAYLIWQLTTMLISSMKSSCWSSFNDLLILISMAPKARSISSSSLVLSSFWRILMNWLVRSCWSCFFLVILVGGLLVYPNSLTDVILAFLDTSVGSSFPHPLPFSVINNFNHPCIPCPYSSTGLCSSASSPFLHIAMGTKIHFK